jgi:DNA-directed RNA polymerase subunit M
MVRNMPSWICPNTKCIYDKQLQPGQYCPLCGEQAKGFNVSEFTNLLKEKWSLKKSMMKSQKREEALRRKKYCPKCGSTNINFPVFYRPSIWKCLDCGYEGAFIIEDRKLAEQKQKKV